MNGSYQWWVSCGAALWGSAHVEKGLDNLICSKYLSKSKTMIPKVHLLTPTLPGSLMQREFSSLVGIHDVFHLLKGGRVDKSCDKLKVILLCLKCQVETDQNFNLHFVQFLPRLTTASPTPFPRNPIPPRLFETSSQIGASRCAETARLLNSTREPVQGFHHAQDLGAIAPEPHTILNSSPTSLPIPHTLWTSHPPNQPKRLSVPPPREPQTSSAQNT
jgi:hypothetical protein